MTPEFKAKWVAALRSGKYQQGINVLRKGDKFCCLGVACDLIDPDAWESTNITVMVPGMKWPGAWESTSTYNIFGWQGLTAKTVDLPFIGISDAETLSNINDSGYTFEEIADYIEGHVVT